ncbi:pro-neuregulin-3, membrane-bound isoform isoform X1 [Synchiropus splendidus]|uniref:pro-neuregulin-3, membrane-bound isoform isoform X1 n=1 Tax=Synchiropus splendidus TaxID=270530 RepID=UPI00237DB578|nr:pro-neuregulin-3, membrane-bound isoform isoform X1 [Synchiropus splendidus]
MSDRSGTGTLAPMMLDETGNGQASPRAPGPLRCGPCAIWPRQQTWLCAVPLIMGFVGLGLSLMLLKWIVVGSVRDYVPTDLVDPKGSIGQDPIFLSKPSAMPKGPDSLNITTTTAAAATETIVSTTPLAADVTARAPRSRSGPPANHSSNGSTANGESNRAPHLHNQIGSRFSETVVATFTTPSTHFTSVFSGKEGTPRSNVRKGIRNGRHGPGNMRPGSGSTSVTPTFYTTTASTGKTDTKVTTSLPSAPVKPTSRLSHGRQGKVSVTRPHHRFKTPSAPTSPSIRSEVFKPCVEDKDLAFCLNEGVCSIIETVAGVHRHCRCKEGYHGLRCDQFVPKTDALLSDPTDELGIEFMESGDIYQRQVLSIFSIASGICLLGVACMALYHRNKRHREKIVAHFMDRRTLRDCSVNASSLMSKSAARHHLGQQSPRCCSDVVHQRTTTAPVALPSLFRILAAGKNFRKGSLTFYPIQRQKEISVFSTPPISRGKLKLLTNLSDKVAKCRHFYRPLQDDETSDQGPVLRRCSAAERMDELPNRTRYFKGREGGKQVPCTCLNKATSSPPSLRTCPVPIIPSLQAYDTAGVPKSQNEGILKYTPVVSTKGHPLALPCENVVAVQGFTPSQVESEASTLEFLQVFKQRHMSRSVAQSRSTHGDPCVDTKTIMAVQHPGETSVQHSLLHSNSWPICSKAAGQRVMQDWFRGCNFTENGRTKSLTS